MNKINVFLFDGVDNLYADKDGNFFYDGKLIKKRWRVGQIYIQVKERRYGMNTLRKLAYSGVLEEEENPFI